MQGESRSMVDRALFFQPGMFERFFDQAHLGLREEGRLVILFSTILQLVQPEVPHPILSELETGRFNLVQKLQRKVKSSPSKNGRRRRTREKVQIWELTKA